MQHHLHYYYYFTNSRPREVTVLKSSQCGKTEAAGRLQRYLDQFALGPSAFYTAALGEAFEPIRKELAPLVRVLPITCFGVVVSVARFPVRQGKKPTSNFLGACLQYTSPGGQGSRDWGAPKPSQAYLDFMARIYRDILLDGEAFVGVDVQRNGSHFSWFTLPKIYALCPHCHGDPVVCGYSWHSFPDDNADDCPLTRWRKKREAGRQADLTDVAEQRKLETQLRELRSRHRAITARREARRSS